MTSKNENTDNLELEKETQQEEEDRKSMARLEQTIKDKGLEETLKQAAERVIQELTELKEEREKGGHNKLHEN